ncbi:MAG: hypothetical protein K2X11_01815 [Acetobacteraceae bacterium]|nr:hypothetical protein [Acetobacteraceae bacterium]
MHDAIATGVILVSLASLMVAGASVVAALRAGSAGWPMLWDTLRSLDTRRAPPEARPHLRRALWAMAVFLIAELGEAAFIWSFPRPPLEWGLRPQ